MLYFTKQKSECTGCSACAAACPVKCIAMEPDAEGFLYPVASEACIRCGRCEAVCPVKKEREPKDLPNKVAIAAVSKNSRIWRRSASGGAFSEICRIWGDDETIVFGAAWNGFRVEHVGVTGVDNIAPLCKSKYVASAAGDSLSQVRQALAEGKKVIFCGTPCQVAGLNGYLGSAHDNLLTIDLICHGVGSPEVFTQCIRAMERDLEKEVISYEFRAKQSAHGEDYLAKLTCSDKKALYLKNDPYIQLFLDQRALRDSCAVPCVFRNANRPGDLTIADCKGLLETYPQLKGTKRNYSTVVANSKKGLAVLRGLEKTMKTLPADLDTVKKYNPLFYRQTYFPKDRNAFLEDFRCDPQAAVKKWTGPMSVYRRSLKHRLFDAAPVLLRKRAIDILNKR